MGKRGVKSIYSDAQWEWVADRYAEGYTLRELGEFLGMDYRTVQCHVSGVRPERRLPLWQLANEFNALRED